MKTIVILLLASLLIAPAALADSIFGSCLTKAGVNCSSDQTISTSFNSKSTKASGGSYDLDLGEKVNSRIAVFCNGKKVGIVEVKGRAKFDVVCK